MEINSSGNVSIANDLTVSGDLNVAGTVNTVNTTTLQVEDKNIVLNYGSGDTSSSADGAGITIQDGVNGTTDATILWNGSSDQFDFSHKINISGNLQSWNVFSQDFYVLNSAEVVGISGAKRNSDRINLNVNSIETYGASYFAGGGTTVPAVHIGSSGNLVRGLGNTPYRRQWLCTRFLQDQGFIHRSNKHMGDGQPWWCWLPKLLGYLKGLPAAWLTGPAMLSSQLILLTVDLSSALILMLAATKSGMPVTTVPTALWTPIP